MELQGEFKKYIDLGIIPFSANIEKKKNEKGEYKKVVKWTQWKKSTLKNPLYINEFNTVGLITGKESGIFVLDIDDVNEWFKILEDEERNEPETATVITGSGGLHYYFRYTDDLDIIPSRTKIIGDKIDSRSNGGCIFAPPSKYYNEETKKVVSYKWKEGKSIFNYEQLPKVPKWLMNLMLKTIEKDKEPKPKQEKEQILKDIKPTEIINLEEKQTIIKLTDEQLLELINMLGKETADNYDSWRNVCFCLKSENKNDYYNLFDEFSKKSKKYNKNNVLLFWNKYQPKQQNNKLTYNSLLFYAKKDDPIKYKEFVKKYLIKDIYNEENFIIKDNLIINQPYLLKNKILEDDDVSIFIKNYLKGDEKVLFIKSPYDTGKTTLLKTITPQYKSILFVSYRITLSENLLGGFSDFEIYYNRFMEDKIICQVDSLDKLTFGSYDLIIIDESESILNHFSAGSLKNQKDTFELFCSYLYNAKKIICLDGDLGNRTKKIISVFGKQKMITNEVKKDTNHFILTPNEEYFNKDIDETIEKKKNIVIVSMSESHCKKLYAKYKDNYKCIIYTSSTGDNDKKLLANVEKIWINYQIIIYSPSIESGVDFNVENYIEKIYVVLCSQSTSQRGLNQMIKRCRKINNKNILVYTNNLNLQDQNVLNYYYYNISEIMAFYCLLLNEKITFECVDGIINRKKEYNYDLYDILTLYNKQEQLNKNNKCFIPYFLKMISDKGHTYEITEGKNIKVKSDINIIHELLINTPKITAEIYDEFIKKQTLRNLDENEKIQIKKYIYEKTFNIDFDNNETVKKYYGRLNIISNAYQLFNDNNKFHNSKILNKEKNEKINAIKNILKLFGLEGIQNQNYILKNKDLKNNIENFDKIIQDNKILLGFEKNKKIIKTNGVIGSLRTLLNNYGIEVITDNDPIKIDKKNVRKGEYIFKLDNVVKNKINDCYFVNFMKDFNFTLDDALIFKVKFN